MAHATDIDSVQKNASSRTTDQWPTARGSPSRPSNEANTNAVSTSNALAVINILILMDEDVVSSGSEHRRSTFQPAPRLVVAIFRCKSTHPLSLEGNAQTYMDKSFTDKVQSRNFSLAQLQKTFTQPMEAAQADEKRENDLIILTK